MTQSWKSDTKLNFRAAAFVPGSIRVKSHPSCAHPSSHMLPGVHTHTHAFLHVVCSVTNGRSWIFAGSYLFSRKTAAFWHPTECGEGNDPEEAPVFHLQHTMARVCPVSDALLHCCFSIRGGLGKSLSSCNGEAGKRHP